VGGFSLLNTIALTFIFSTITFALLIMSDEGFRITKSEINAYIAKVNSEYGINKGLAHYLTTGECKGSGGSDTEDGNVNGGEYQIIYRNVEVNGQHVGCFIWAKGKKGNAEDIRVVFAKAIPVNTLGGLMIDNVGDDFSIDENPSNGFQIQQDDEKKCAAMVYHDAEDENDIKNYDGTEIEKLVKSSDPLDLGIDMDGLHNFIINKFQNPPNYSDTDFNVIVTNVTECTFNAHEIKCNGNNIDINPGDSVKIVGTNITINFNNNGSIDLDKFLIESSGKLTVNVNNYEISSEKLILRAEGNIDFKIQNVGSFINGDFYAISENGNIKIKLYAGYINGNTYVKAENGDIEVTLQNQGEYIGKDGGENVFIAKENVSINLKNNDQFLKGKTYITSLDYERINISLENDQSDTSIPSVKAVMVSEEISIDIKNKKVLEGIIVGDKIRGKDSDSLKLDNDVKLRGLIVALNKIEKFEGKSNASVEGLFFIKEIEKFSLKNNATIKTNIDLVNTLLNEFGIGEDIIPSLNCEGASAGNVKIVYYLPPATAY